MAPLNSQIKFKTVLKNSTVSSYFSFHSLKLAKVPSYVFSTFLLDTKFTCPPQRMELDLI